MKTLLLDQGLPRSAVFFLKEAGFEAVHVGEVEMAAATDFAILNFAASHDYVVVTLDSDFHALLATQKSLSPSVIRIRIEGMKGAELANLLKVVIQCAIDDILKGAAISVTENGIRIRHFPLS